MSVYGCVHVCVGGCTCMYMCVHVCMCICIYIILFYFAAAQTIDGDYPAHYCDSYYGNILLYILSLQTVIACVI